MSGCPLSDCGAGRDAPWCAREGWVGRESEVEREVGGGREDEVEVGEGEAAWGASGGCCDERWGESERAGRAASARERERRERERGERGPASRPPAPALGHRHPPDLTPGCAGPACSRSHSLLSRPLQLSQRARPSMRLVRPPSPPPPPLVLPDRHDGAAQPPSHNLPRLALRADQCSPARSRPCPRAHLVPRVPHGRPHERLPRGRPGPCPGPPFWPSGVLRRVPRLERRHPPPRHAHRRSESSSPRSATSARLLALPPRAFR